MNSRILEALHGVDKGIETAGKTVGVDLEVAGGPRPGVLENENHVESAAPCHGDDVIGLGRIESGDEEVRSFDPGRALVPDAVGMGTGQVRGDFEPLHGVEKLLLRADEEAEARGEEPVPGEGLEVEGLGLRAPEQGVRTLKIFEQDGLLVSIALHNGLDMIDHARHRFADGQTVVVDAERGDVVVAQGVESRRVDRDLLPALEGDRNVGVAVAAAPVIELDLDLLAFGIAVNPGADGGAAGEVEGPGEVMAHNAPAARLGAGRGGEPGRRGADPGLVRGQELVGTPGLIGVAAADDLRVGVHVDLGRGQGGHMGGRAGGVQRRHDLGAFGHG